MAINVTSFEQIAPILSHLATNYSNIFFDYFNMFYNDTPMEITIEYYDKENNIQSITVPNRAMDREFILNGHGDPNGNVVAGKGAIYQDLDDGLLYIKQTDISESNGWNKLVTLSADSVANSLEDFLIQGSGNPEGSVEAARGVLYVNTLLSELFIKTTDNGTIGWTKISAQIDNLADKSLSDLTPAGEAHFANPSLSNLDDDGNQKFDEKENVGNKRDIIDGTGSSQLYPSTKAVYDFITDTESQLANRNLDNLTTAGYDRFVKSDSQVRDCILKAPSGLVSYTAGTSQDSIVLKSGTVLLCANGIDSINKTGINKSVTLTQDLTVAINWGASANDGVIFYVENVSAENPNPRVEYYVLSAYDRGAQPSSGTNRIWYDIVNNRYQSTSDSGSTWTDVVAAEIGRFSTDSSGRVIGSSFKSYAPLRAATVDDIRNSSLKIENAVSDLSDQIGSLSTSKANVSFSNVDDSAKIIMSNMGMPSNKQVNVNWNGTNDATFTAPADGWVQLTRYLKSGHIMLYIDGSPDGICMNSYNTSSTNHSLNVFIPVRKNDVYGVNYSGTMTSDSKDRFLFIYAEGSQSLAP